MAESSTCDPETCLIVVVVVVGVVVAFSAPEVLSVPLRTAAPPLARSGSALALAALRWTPLCAACW